jgi:hypothetical protein
MPFARCNLSRTSAASAAFFLASSWLREASAEPDPRVRGGPPTLRGTEEDWFVRRVVPWGKGRAFSARGSGVDSLLQMLPMALESRGEGRGRKGGRAGLEGARATWW